MEKVKHYIINRILRHKPEQNKVVDEDTWLKQISHLPECNKVRFNGSRSIEYRLDKYCYASITRHPPLYRVIEPILTHEEHELIQSIRDRMLRTVTHESQLERAILELMDKLAIEIPPYSKERIIYYLLRDFTGYGMIDPLIKDVHIEDISCNGVGVPIYVLHRYFGSIKTNLSFNDENMLDNFVARLALRSGKSISVAKPILDAGMPDGNRVNITYSREITPKGSTFTIRKFKTSVITPVQLIQHGTISPEMLAYLWVLIEHKSSIMVFGETGSGKTTLLNAFSLFIPPEMKIVSIEDTPEISLPHKNWIQLVTRSSFSGEGGEITMFELLKASLRQRPDYLIVGEIRGEEAKVLFQAISTGQLGLSTMHASSAEGVIDRLTSPPMNIPLSLITSIGCLCHQITINYKGSIQRRTKAITEVIKHGNEVELKTVFEWNPATGFDNKASKLESTARKLGLGWESHQIATIAKRRGVDKEEIEEEMKQKASLLRKMAKNNADITEVISEYYANYLQGSG